MPTQPTRQSHAENLTVLSEPAPQAWFAGTAEDGVDARVELATLIAGSDSGDRVAVRDPLHPTAPALLFALPDWNALHGRGGPEIVDLR